MQLKRVPRRRRLEPNEFERITSAFMCLASRESGCHCPNEQSCLLLRLGTDTKRTFPAQVTESLLKLTNWFMTFNIYVLTKFKTLFISMNLVEK